MEGWELYELYEQYNLELNSCSVDSWEEMDERDRAVWNKMAANLPD